MLWIRIALLVLASGSTALGSEFCAVRVVVTDKDGEPASALVELRDSADRVVQRSMADNGVANFCDFDFGEHSIRIGGTTCTNVIIPHVAVVFGVMQVFRAYVNECAGWDIVVPRVCRFYFRLGSSDGGLLPGVILVSQLAGANTTTDAYGRALVRASVGETGTLTFSKPGYVPHTLPISCPSPGYSEKGITLYRVSK